LSDVGQQEREQYGIDLTEVRHEPRETQSRLRLFVAVLVVWPFGMVLGTLYWMHTGAYTRHLQGEYLHGIGYGSTLSGANCQVLIDGDSTAMVGILPSLLTQRTGLTACNIADVAGVQMVNGPMPLDDYLQHNARPRFLIFSVTPESLSLSQGWTWVSPFEGILYRLRFHPDAGAARIFAHHTSDVLVGAELGFRTGLQSLASRPLPPEQANFRALHNGWQPEPGKTLTQCDAGDVRERAPDAAYLTSLRQKYGVGGTQVLIDVMPMPACDPSFPFYRAHLQPGMIDNRLDTLPISAYNATGRLHTNEDGAVLLTQRIADQVNAAVKGGR